MRDPTGLLLAWIDIGAPSAERLHKAAKAAQAVALFTSADLSLLQRQAATRQIHRVADIAVWRMEPAFLDALGERTSRHTKLELVRNDGQLYVTIDSAVSEGTLTRCSLVAAQHA